MIWCLHGFLGEGSDWDFLAGAMREHGIAVVAPSLFARPIEGTMETWSAGFANDVASRDDRPVVVGYSLGGRLALHALLIAPRLFRAAVIISAGLGTESEAERKVRREEDEQWARRFESEPWHKVVGPWNAQPLFAGHSTSPAESHFSRAALAHALRAWSPAVHEPLAPKLPLINIPVLWVAGERDAKYVAAARRAVSALPMGELWVCPDSGHRVPREQPALLVERLRPFLLKHTKQEDSDGQRLEKTPRLSGHPIRGD